MSTGGGGGEGDIYLNSFRDREIEIESYEVSISGIKRLPFLLKQKEKKIFENIPHNHHFFSNFRVKTVTRINRKALENFEWFRVFATWWYKITLLDFDAI